MLSVFSIYTAFFGVLSDMLQRSFHLALVMVLIFTTHGALARRSSAKFRVVLDALLMAVGFAVLIYHVVFFTEISNRWGELTEVEFWLGIVCVVCLLEATRRVIGWPIVILAVAFLAYAFAGPYLPGMLFHRGYSLERVVAHLYLGGGGIFGTPLGVSATFVIMIVIFGAMLERSGAGKVLMDIATGATGRSRGGPAKAAVVGSSLMGMISGTAVANVLTTGTISIPLMKRNGYQPHVAGAVEAVASTGGQLMPPVMGAAAFIMADLTERPYLEIATAAILPSFLYYMVLFMVVHLEAVKRSIPILTGEDLPGIRATLLGGGHLLVSLVVFAWMLIAGYSVMYASFWAIVATLAASYVKRSTWLTPKELIGAFIDGAHAILPVAAACATAGIIIGVITLTGLGLKFSSLIIAASGDSLVIALILTLIASLVLGMGLPTAAAYILVSTLVAPALVNLGVDLLAAHLFCFYGAMLSAITPPVAMAAYAAAGLANANPFRIAVTAVRFGIAAFIVPFFFVMNPALIGIGGLAAIVMAAITATVGSVAIAGAVQGWLLVRMSVIERIVIFGGGLLLMAPETTSDLVGAALLAAGMGYQWYRRKAESARNAPTGAAM
ncbi:MAG: TRAP transporter permease [Hyphomicrobiales bacterium]|nr:TRAP transporter permease [Hyphomicrobiales bacterium]MCP5370989.1 TRAP transporter permease [Hyphomicrobiales bacterium]